jgi:hypothetical protein
MSQADSRNTTTLSRPPRLAGLSMAAAPVARLRLGAVRIGLGALGEGGELGRQARARGRFGHGAERNQLGCGNLQQRRKRRPSLRLRASAAPKRLAACGPTDSALDPCHRVFGRTTWPSRERTA